MFPTWNMPYSIQHLSHQEMHHKLHPDWYTDDYHSVEQVTTLQPALQNVQKMKRRKRTSRQYIWMMNIGLLRKYLKEHCAFMWAWITAWVMPIPMPLCKLSDAFLHGQLGFKWHFRLWGLYGYIQQWRHTSIWGYALLRDTLVWFEHYIIY